MLYFTSSIGELPGGHPATKIKHCFMTLAEKIRWAMEQAGLSPAELARRMDESPQTVNGWLKTGRIAKTKLGRFAEVTAIDLKWLLDPTGNVAEERASYGKKRGVPVIGLAVANPIEDGYFDDQGFPPGAGSEYVPWPSRDPNAYALRVRGDSMQDRIRHGDIVVVEPGANVLPGDDVLVKTRNGRKMVKRLRHRRGDEVTLGSVNQTHRDLTVLTEEIESIHRIAAILPRGTFTEEDS